MLLPLAAAALAVVMQVKVDTKTRTDSTGKKKERVVSINIGPGGGGADRGGSAPRRIPVTAEHRRTAFRDASARALLGRAREARLRQDSALLAYDAGTYQRISAGLGIGKVGRDRLLFRSEQSGRVRWSRRVGAWVEVTGARAAMPGLGKEANDDVRKDAHDEAEDMLMLPYRPGQEQLFVGGGAVKAEVDERNFVHPLAEGAEAYYTYASGDSTTMRLPNGSVIRILELAVRPREPRWNTVVGSLWFDADRGQLVRAAYRLAMPLDVWAMADQEARRDTADGEHEVPRVVKGMLSPMRGQIRAVAVEYGLYGGGRFWLPRMQYAEGDAQVSFMRVPFKVEQGFRYTSVNGADSPPPIAVAARPEWEKLPAAQRDSVRDRYLDSLRTARRARRDSVDKGQLAANADCDADGMRTTTRTRGEGELKLDVATRIPCDRAKLEHSPDLPKSIFAEGEEVVSEGGEELMAIRQRAEMIAQALSLGAQAGWGPRAPQLSYGLRQLRYNRVEGLSFGARAEVELGKGYAAAGALRLGVADLEPNALLELSRTDLTRTARVRGYNQLVSAGDWGDPLDFGSSLSAVLFGRDEGLYYRTSGAELSGARTRASGAPLYEWRLFAERHRAAVRETDWSIAGDMDTPDLPVTAGNWAGAGFRLSGARGLDPAGFRLFGDLRLEGAAARRITSADVVTSPRYARAAADLTISQGIGTAVAGVTLSAGTSAGDLPVQRLWYLGGAHTVRGQKPATAAGDAFWLTRAELGAPAGPLRAVIFGDLGWAGSRRTWHEVGRPLSGAGVGFSFLDGLVRFDVAKGIWPGKQVRVDLTVDAKF